MDRVQLRCRCAVEGHVQPVVVLDPLGRAVLVGTEGYAADSGATLHFDESDLNECLGVFRMRASRDEIEASVFGFDTLDNAAACLFVPDRR